jgi:23S rRNA (pseudouridine1915-N3)-methyltransferase
MRVTVIAVGRLKAGPERELVARYAERFSAAGRAVGLDGPSLVEIAESAARAEGERKAQEAKAILAAMPTGALVVALDERGKAIGSAAFAERIARERDAGRRDLALVIGGADGLDPALREQAALCVSFGAMTLPHQLVRVLALEQLYRTVTILSGHPYHRV